MQISKQKGTGKRRRCAHETGKREVTIFYGSCTITAWFSAPHKLMNKRSSNFKKTWDVEFYGLVDLLWNCSTVSVGERVVMSWRRNRSIFNWGREMSSYGAQICSLWGTHVVVALHGVRWPSAFGAKLRVGADWMSLGSIQAAGDHPPAPILVERFLTRAAVPDAPYSWSVLQLFPSCRLGSSQVGSPG